jgi:hypothetical protein
VTFRRLSAGHLLAFLAALALLLTLAPDWYTDKTGESLRDTQGKIIAPVNEETTPSQSELHARAAEEREKNAWQADGVVDRVILVLLIATAGLAAAGAFMRAAGRAAKPPTPNAIASLTGLVAAGLIAYRIIDPPGFNEAAVVKWGAPAGLVCVGLVAIGSRMAVRAERESAPPEPAPPDAEAPDAPASPAGAA